MPLKTEGVKVLVQDVLAAFSEPYSKDIILDVCIAVEKTPKWKKRYDELSDELRYWVVNNWIGQYVASETGLKSGKKVSVRGKCNLIKNYKKLEK